ncbi:MAG: hypothetical protein C0478_16535, partial [Planctomyces sp.]|nr:hypothetical protein [Planctomyces sp.]
LGFGRYPETETAWQSARAAYAKTFERLILGQPLEVDAARNDMLIPAVHDGAHHGAHAAIHETPDGTSPETPDRADGEGAL